MENLPSKVDDAAKCKNDGKGRKGKKGCLVHMMSNTHNDAVCYQREAPHHAKGKDNVATVQEPSL